MFHCESGIILGQSLHITFEVGSSHTSDCPIRWLSGAESLKKITIHSDTNGEEWFEPVWCFLEASGRLQNALRCQEHTWESRVGLNDSRWRMNYLQLSLEKDICQYGISWSSCEYWERKALDNFSAVIRAESFFSTIEKLEPLLKLWCSQTDGALLLQVTKWLQT